MKLSTSVVQASLSAFMLSFTCASHAALPWKWQQIKPGMSVDQLLQVAPKARLLTKPETKRSGKAMVGWDNIRYDGGMYFVEFEFLDGRLSDFGMQPHISLPPLADVMKFVEALRKDALNEGGKIISSTINFRKKNAYGDEDIDLAQWRQQVRCMPFSNMDVVEIRVRFSPRVSK